MSSPLLSFITVNYNGLKDTCELIDSIQQVVHSVVYEIIVVDNASRNDEAKTIQSQYPDVIVIGSGKNLGFAGGNNLGIRQASGKYLFLINNDTYFEEDHILDLLKRLESSPRIGGISPKLRFAFFPRNIQYTGFTPLSPISLRNETIGYGQSDNGQFDTPHSTPFLHGAAMLIKKDVIEKVGLMSEMFFLYYEEMDWCTRMTDAGYELWYEPCCTVFHKESQSIGKYSQLQVFYLTRNRLLYAWRNRHGQKRFFSILYLFTIATAKNSIYFCIKRDFSLAITIYRAIFAFVKLPHKMD